jgi:hypothetical protein
LVDIQESKSSICAIIIALKRQKVYRIDFQIKPPCPRAYLDFLKSKIVGKLCYFLHMFLQNTGCLAAEQEQLFFGACPKSGMVQEKGPDLSVRLHSTTTHF